MNLEGPAQPFRRYSRKVLHAFTCAFHCSSVIKFLLYGLGAPFRHLPSGKASMSQLAQNQCGAGVVFPKAPVHSLSWYSILPPQLGQMFRFLFFFNIYNPSASFDFPVSKLRA
jgi:hypothetical protein